MRKLVLGLVVLLASACGGASSAEIRTAREAHYTAPASGLFADVEGAVEGEYKIARSDPGELALVTEEKWFNPEGAVESGGGLTDGSYNLQLLVKLIEGGDQVSVEVTPIVRIIHTGQSQLEDVPPDSAKIPGWVTGRVDNLYLAIHGKLKGQVVGGPAPAAP